MNSNDNNDYMSNDWFFIEDNTKTDLTTGLSSEYVMVDNDSDPLSTLDNMIMNDYEEVPDPLDIFDIMSNDECIKEVSDPLEALDSMIMNEDECIKEVSDPLESLESMIMSDDECIKEVSDPLETLDNTDTDQFQHQSKLMNEYRSHHIYISNLEHILKKNIYITTYWD